MVFDYNSNSNCDGIESKYRLLFERALDIILLVDINGKILDANHAAVKKYGFTNDELILMNIRDLCAPDERDSADGKLKEAYTKGVVYETVYLCKGGSTFPAEVSSRGLNGTKILVTIIRDISKRKDAERNLSRIAAIVESSDDAILGMTLDGLITEWNYAAEKIYGYTAKDALGQSVEMLIPKEHIGELSHIIEVIKQGGRIEHFDTVRITKNKNSVMVSLTASPILGPKGELWGISWTARDITERKRAEVDLKEAKDQAEIYLDLISHDISNMHQIIEGQLELAHEIMTQNGKLEGDEIELIDTPLSIMERSNSLIDNVRKLQKLRGGVYGIEAIDLDKLLSEVVAEYSSIPGKNVNIDHSPVSDYMVMANPLLKDVFSNLIDNAIKHSKDPVRIWVKVDRVIDNDSPFYRVSIEDNGPGIPDSNKYHVFHRFSRGLTKTKGTGLGLYLVKTLVDSFNGIVKVEDRVQGDYTKGARFVVMLPAVDK